MKPPSKYSRVSSEVSALPEGEAEKLIRPQSDGRHQVSFAQERMWFLWRLDPDSHAYNISLSLRLRGVVDVDILRRALQAIVMRHESLRSFYLEIDGKPQQRILEISQVECPLIIPEGAAEIENWASSFSSTFISQPFRLSEPPLYRTALLQLGKDDHLLLIVVHHIISDGWSTQNLSSELSIAYRDYLAGITPRLPSLPIQYSDFAAWQRSWSQSSDYRRQLSYWREKLRDLPEELTLPFSKQRGPIQLYSGDRIEWELDSRLLDSFRRICLEEKATLFMGLLTVFFALLNRYTGQSDLAVGSVVANRNKLELEPLIGFFVNTVVLRVAVEKEANLLTLMRKVRQVCLEAYSNQDVPFEHLVSEIDLARDLSRPTLFQCMFSLENTAFRLPELPGLQIESADIPSRTAKFDLDVDLWELPSGKIRGLVEFNFELFSRSTIERMFKHYVRLLEALVASPLTSVHDLDFRLENEQSAVLVAEQVSLLKESQDTCLDRFRHFVRSDPDSLAVVDHERRWTYEGIYCVARSVAETLINSSDSRIGIILPKSGLLYSAIVGCWIAGKTPVLFNPDDPKEMIQAAMDRVSLSRILSMRRVCDRLKVRCETVTCLEDIDMSCMGEEEDFNPSPQDGAYVVFTSGTTGLPRAIEISHRALLNAVEGWKSVYGIGSADVHLQLAAISFDVFWGDLVRALCLGGALVLIDRHELLSPPDLLKKWRENEASICEITPPVLRTLLSYVEENDQSLPRATRALILGSDVARNADIVRLKKVLSDEARIFNSYGLAEACIDSTVEELSDIGDPSSLVSVGKPFPGSHVYVLDANRSPVPVGVAGSIWVGGSGVARGYVNSNSDEQRRFQPDPFSSTPDRLMFDTGDWGRVLENGSLYLSGRFDQQVKVRGVRVETAEVEGALCSIPGVSEAAVFFDKSADSLVGFVVAGKQPGQDASDRDREICGEWSEVFDSEDFGSPTSSELEFAGWTDSFSGEPIPREQMNAWAAEACARCLPDESNLSVLEIGCGNGIIAKRIIGKCRRFVGADISSTALGHLKKSLGEDKQNAATTEFIHADALSIRERVDGDFDCVILNSVAQYFPSIEYFEAVLKDAIGLCCDGGQVYVGDIRNADLLEYFLLNRNKPFPAEMTSSQLLAKLGEDVLLEEELLISPRWFEEIGSAHSRVARIRIMKKGDGYDNELSRYRYDVLIDVGNKGTGIVLESSLDDPRSNADWAFVKAVSSLNPLELVKNVVTFSDRVSASSKDAALDRPLATRPHRARDILRLRRTIFECLSSRLTAAAVPSRIVFCDRLPLSNNSKIDRAKLRYLLPITGAQRRRSPAEAVTESQRRLWEIWANVLPAGADDMDGDFFQKGGHSLLAVQLASRIRQVFGKDIGLKKIFEYRTIRRLADELDSLGEESPGLAILHRNRYDGSVRPVSAGQKRLWFLSKFDGASAAYNIVTLLRFDGPIDSVRVEQAVSKIIGRHEVLRTAYFESDGIVSATVTDSMRVPLDDRLGESPRTIAEQEALLRELARMPFVLSEGPLFRIHLIRGTEGESYLLFVIHHIVADGWSLEIIAREFVESYFGVAYPVKGAPGSPQIEYADYVESLSAWRDSPSGKKSADFWTRHLGMVHSYASFPADFTRPTLQTYQGFIRRFSIGGRAYEEIYRHAENIGVTPAAFFLALYAILYSRHSSDRKPIIGIPSSGRVARQLEDVVGLMANLLPIRIQVAESVMFTDYCRMVQDTLLECLNHELIQFDEIVDLVKAPRARNFLPLAQVGFSYLQMPHQGLEHLPPSVSPQEFFPGHAKFDVDLEIWATGKSFEFAMCFNSDLYTERTANEIVLHFEDLIQRWSNNNTVLVGELLMTSLREENALLSVGAGKDLAESCERSVSQIILHELAANPERIAICHDGTPTSGEQLLSLIERVSEFVWRRSPDSEVAIGVLGNKSAELVAAMIGIMRQGHYFLVLDPNSPVEKLSAIIKEAALDFIIDLRSTLVPLHDTTTELVAWQSVLSVPDARLSSSASLVTEGGYLIFTSGSTGSPKGIRVSAAALRNAVSSWRDIYGLRRGWKHLQLASVTFDVFVGDVFRALASGGSLILASQDVLIDSEKLFSLVESGRPQFVEFVPSVLLPLAAYCEFHSHTFALIDCVVVGSEGLYWNDVKRIKKVVHPDTRLFNSYGAAEATIDSAVYQIPKDIQQNKGNVPVGRPVHNTLLVVVDRERRLLPRGTEGELAILGAGLSDGYINNFVANKTSFVNVRLGKGVHRAYLTGDKSRLDRSGNFEILGRIDDQLKIGGIRVELGEIEAALRSVPGVDEAAVVLSSDSKTVDGIYVSRGNDLDERFIKEHLGRRLPATCHPRVLLKVDSIPLNSSNKVDRNSVVELIRNRPMPNVIESEFMSDSSRCLRSIWKNMFPQGEITSESDFFELGGSSLRLLELAHHIRCEFGVELCLAEFFECSLFGMQCARLERHRGESRDSCS